MFCRVGLPCLFAVPLCSATSPWSAVLVCRAGLVVPLLRSAVVASFFCRNQDCWRLGIMKGCVCTVRHIVFSESETFPKPNDEEDVVHLRCMPVSLWLQAADASWTLHESHFPDDMPVTTDRKGLFQLRPTYAYLRATWEEETFSVRRTTFQVLPADTIIVYGAQGGTFDAVIVDMERPPNMDADTHWLACYVMLSRPRSLEGLLILRRAAREELGRPPPAFLLRELERLKDRED